MEGETAIYLIPRVGLKLEFGASSKHGQMRTFEVVGPDLAVGCIAREVAESGGTETGQGNLSPMAPVTLSPEARWSASVPLGATHFAFIYPMICLAGDHERLIMEYAVHADEGNEKKIAWLHALLFGAYAYFDATQSLLQVNAISLMPSKHRIYLDGPFSTGKSVHDVLDKLERVQPVTLRHLADTGLTHFAWVNPSESPGEQALSADEGESWEHGAFVYRQVPQSQPGANAEAFIFFRVGLNPPKSHPRNAMERALHSMYKAIASATDEQRQLALEVALWRRSPLETWLRRHTLWLAAYYLVGCGVYYLLEGWHALDAAYFLTATVTTVGYGDFSPSGAASQAFTIVYAPLGAILILEASVTLVEPFLRRLNASTGPWLARTRQHVARWVPCVGVRRGHNDDTEAGGGASWWQSANAQQYLALASGPLLSLLVITLVAVAIMGESLLSGTYFGVITMTTIGFGDISPQEWPGKICLTILMPLSTAALALALKDAAKLATRDNICAANFKMQVQQMLLQEAAGEPDKKLSKAAFTLAVLKEYDLVDDALLSTIDDEYQRLVGIGVGGAADDGSFEKVRSFKGGSGALQGAAATGAAATGAAPPERELDCSIVFEHLVRQRRVRHKQEVKAAKGDDELSSRELSSRELSTPGRVPSASSLSRDARGQSQKKLLQERSNNQFGYSVFGASVHYTTVDMSVPDRGFSEWYESYWKPAVQVEADLRAGAFPEDPGAEGGAPYGVLLEA